MAIKDLTPRQGKVFIEADVIAKSSPREFNKFGKAGRVCDAEIKDDTGTIKLTLWNEQVDMVNVGDRVSVKNGYVSEYKGDLQLSTGKFGSLEVIGKSDGAAGSDKKQENEAIEDSFEEPKDLKDFEDESLDDVDEEFVD